MRYKATAVVEVVLPEEQSDYDLVTKITDALQFVTRYEVEKVSVWERREEQEDAICD